MNIWGENVIVNLTSTYHCYSPMARKSFHAAHLELRNKTYFAVLYVPKDVRLLLNKSKFTKSTRTGDSRLAQQRADAFVLGWKNQISQARNQSDDPLIAEAQDLLMNLKASSNPSLVREVIDERTDEISKSHAPFIAEEFRSIATGKRKLLEPILQDWIELETARGLKKKTIDQMVLDVGKLVDLFPTANLLNREYVEIWINNLDTKKSLSPSSVNRIFAFCRNFFRYLQSINEISKDQPNPFVVPDKFKKTKRKNTNSVNKTESWLDFKPDDVALLHHNAFIGEDYSLADLILIGAYTGARIEEICSLKCSNVDLKMKCFEIVDSKTEAGIRTIPIHSKIRKRVKELMEESEDGYLLSGLTFNKYGNRSNAIGKRFGRLKKKNKFSDRYVFHSIRKTLITMLENAGVSENLAADIVGHEKPRITYGLYSSGATPKEMRVALEKVSYKFDSN